MMMMTLQSVCRLFLALKQNLGGFVVTRGKSKGKIHPITDHEGPELE